MEQIVGGIRPGEEAQVQQAKVVQRIQANLERLAALGQLAHAVLPQSVHEVSTPVSEAIPKLALRCAFPVAMHGKTLASPSRFLKEPEVLANVLPCIAFQ